MPRLRRSDSAPLIGIDVGLVQFRDGLKANHRSSPYGVSAYRKSRDDGHYLVNDRLRERLAHIRKDRSAKRLPALDEGLVHELIAHFRMAKATPEIDKDGTPTIENGKYLYCLRVVGCRVYMNYEQIAAAYNVSVSTVDRHIGIMCDEGLIVNKCQGYGKNKQSSWYEFDATLAWRGDSTLREAYILVQPSMAPLTIISGDREYRWGSDGGRDDE